MKLPILAALVVPEELRLKMIEHAEREAPREAVGMLAGRGPVVERVTPLRNCASHQHAFFADPYEQFKAERSFARDGLEVVALYHSHPEGGAVPSEADREFFAEWRCSQVIIVPSGKSQRSEPEVRAYRWVDTHLREISIYPYSC